jgi:hypothetical protein
MKSISNDSLKRRQHWLEKRLRSTKRWNAHSGFSDFQILRRQEQASYTLIFAATFFLMRFGIEAIFEAEGLIDFGAIVAVVILVSFFYLGYTICKLRWALEAFEYFAPQGCDQLKQTIAEQGGDGDAEEAV